MNNALVIKITRYWYYLIHDFWKYHIHSHNHIFLLRIPGNSHNLWILQPKFLLQNSNRCHISWGPRHIYTLQWRHNERDGVPNHQPHDYLLYRLFGHRSKTTSKLRVTGLCEGNSPVTGECPTGRVSNGKAGKYFYLITSSWHLYTYCISWC